LEIHHALLHYLNRTGQTGHKAQRRTIHNGTVLIFDVRTKIRGRKY